MSMDLRRLLREASRATSRHRALLSAGLVAASVATALPSLAPTPAPGVGVVTAARDLPAGTSLAQGDLGDWCESAGVVTLALEGGAESR